MSKVIKKRNKSFCVNLCYFRNNLKIVLLENEEAIEGQRKGERGGEKKKEKERDKEERDIRKKKRKRGGRERERREVKRKKKDKLPRKPN